jgi:hypothetical protein
MMNELISNLFHFFYIYSEKKQKSKLEILKKKKHMQIHI